MKIEGDHLGEPATVKLNADRVIWSYRLAPLHGRWETALLELMTIELRPARFRGLEPFHPLAVFFAIGAYFAKMPWLAIAFTVAGIGHAIFRVVRPPQVLVLDSAKGRFELVVARRSLADARELVRLRAAR